MTTHASRRPTTRLDLVREQAAELLGPKAAKRFATFHDGTVYIKAGEGLRFLAWLIDFIVYAVLGCLGLVAAAVAYSAGKISAGLLVGLMAAVVVAVPVLYGLFFGDGRALGGVLTGTQLVRNADGGRVGYRACWAMTVRLLLVPLLLVAVVTGADAGGGSGTAARVSVDRAATNRLRAAGIIP
ncbi:RDD family protein [Hamadaea sp. NPDC051192]|uniref:RDD family protein n=1 Tax=Hamadaea sp. NPDC051192 TaxID=3154940 RepID=UPI00342234D5